PHPGPARSKPPQGPPPPGRADADRSGRGACQPCVLRPTPAVHVCSGSDVARGSLVGHDSPLEPLPSFNGSLDGVVAASTAEAAALVSGAAGARYGQSTLIGQAYAAADDLATCYLTSPPAPVLAEANEYRRQVLRMLHVPTPPTRPR